MADKSKHNRRPTRESNPDVDKDADLIKTRMKASAPGDLVSYDELGKIVGRTIKSQDRALRKALKELWNEDVTFDNEATVGYRRRDNDAEFVRGNKNRLGIHRRYKKARKEAGLVKREELEPDKKPLHDARQSLFAMGAKETHGNSVNATARKQRAPVATDVLDQNKKWVQDEISRSRNKK